MFCTVHRIGGVVTRSEYEVVWALAGVHVGESCLRVFCVVGVSSVASFFCFCLLILCKREKACAFIMCPVAYCFGFSSPFDVSVFAVFVATLMESWRDGCLFLRLEVVVFLLAFSLTIIL